MKKDDEKRKKKRKHALITESKEATEVKGSIYVRASFSNDQKINLQARRRPQQTVKCDYSNELYDH